MKRSVALLGSLFAIFSVFSASGIHADDLSTKICRTEALQVMAYHAFDGETPCPSLDCHSATAHMVGKKNGNKVVYLGPEIVHAQDELGKLDFNPVRSCFSTLLSTMGQTDLPLLVSLDVQRPADFDCRDDRIYIIQESDIKGVRVRLGVLPNVTYDKNVAKALVKIVQDQCRL